MKVWRLLLAVFAIACGRTTGFAGPITVTISAGNLTTSPWAPALGMALVPVSPPGTTYSFDPAANEPVVAEVVAYEPQRLPTPAPIDIHPDGTTHWNNDGIFGIDMKVTDVDSGESRTVHLSGRAHMYNTYSTGNGWFGTTYFWFMDSLSFRLGENDYTIWGAKQFEDGPASVNIWVGPNAPVPDAPEPCTLLMGAIGIVPLGVHRLKRRHAHRNALNLNRESSQS